MTSRPSDHSDSSFFCLPCLMMCQHHATCQPARYDLSGSAMLLVRQRTRRYFAFIDCRNQPSEWLKNNYIRRKIFIKVYLIENKEVTLLMQLNW